MTIDDCLHRRCQQLGITPELVEDVMRAPDARELTPDGVFQARRRLDDERTLVVQYREKWKPKVRNCTVVHAWFAD